MAPLSQRGNIVAKGVMSHVPQAMLDASRFPRAPETAVDLALAENWLVRAETLDLVHAEHGDALKAEHMSLPVGVWGDPELLECLAALFNQRFHPATPVLSSHISTTPGAGASIDLLANNLCDAGDGVLLPAPYWGVNDLLLLIRSGVRPVPANVGSDLVGSLEEGALIPALEEALAGASCPVRALMLANPHNPIGRCYSRDALRECLRFCERHDIHLISDEVFALSTFNAPDAPANGFHSLLSLDPRAEDCDPARVHVIWSLSKSLGASGIRMGCTVSQANPDLRNAVALTASMQNSTLSNLFAKKLLGSPRLLNLIGLSSERLAENYGLITAFFRERQIEYVGANAGVSILARLDPGARTLTDAEALVAKLAAAGVLVSPGHSFHMPDTHVGWFRVCFAVEQSALRTALARMAPVLATATQAV